MGLAIPCFPTVTNGLLFSLDERWVGWAGPVGGGGVGENVSTSQAIFCALLSLQTFFCGYFFLLTIFCPANKSLLIKFANFFFASP
jgi:hypothetical protein